MCHILGKLIFNFALENLIRSSLRLGKFLRGLVQMGLEWICSFCVSLSCVNVACVSALSRFFLLFRFCFLPFSFFRLSSFFFPFFFVFFVFLHLRFSLFVSRDLSVFCTFPGSCCRLSLSLRLRGNCKNTKKGGISLRPRLHQLCQKLSKRCSFFKTQTQWPKLWADQWYERGSHYGKPPAHYKKKKSPKIFWCNVSAQYSIINYFRFFWWM